MSDRQSRCSAFLAKSGWSGAGRTAIAGDASGRLYDRLKLADRSAILMDSPPDQGDSPADFVRIGTHLRRIGLHAPEILAHDLEHGFLLLEDLGDMTFAKALTRDLTQEAVLYSMACDVLVTAQAHPVPTGIPDLSAQDWAEAGMLALDWYAFSVGDERPDPIPLRSALAEALARHADGPRVLILRDYHAENLMWVSGFEGLDQVGVLDFQLGQNGQPGYDLVSLLQDARRDVTRDLESAMIVRFCTATGAEMASFRRAYAVLGVQRAMRILGIFARLCLVSGKAGYLQHVPRVWGHLQRNLMAADLAPLTELCNRLLPAPSAQNLDRIARKCAQFPQA
jgi:N-acetylmuramate 1-kinase